jgi:hypothetical protein
LFPRVPVIMPVLLQESVAGQHGYVTSGSPLYRVRE